MDNAGCMGGLQPAMTIMAGSGPCWKIMAGDRSQPSIGTRPAMDDAGLIPMDGRELTTAVTGRRECCPGQLQCGGSRDGAAGGGSS